MQVAFHNKSQTGGAHSQRLKQMANGRFVIECLKLIEFATAIGDKEAVQEIRKRAASVVDDPRLRETDNRRDKAGSSQMGTNEAGSIERRPSQAQPDLRNSDGQEQPKLRFLAWQEENKKPSDGGAWHADGTPVAEKAELEVFGNVPPTIFSVVGSELAKDNPRFLQLWFSHPAIDQQSYRSVTLLDAVGKPLPLAANGSLGSGIRLPNNDNENLGWITYTLSPGAVDHTPKTADIHLEYSVGAWKVGKVIAPSFSGVMTLWRGAMLNGIGQNAAGNAFISVAENLNHVETTQLSFTATTKDGRELVNPSNTHGGPRGGLVQMEQFEFDVPLEETGELSRRRPIPEELTGPILNEAIKAIEEDDATAITFGCLFMGMLADELRSRPKERGFDVLIINPLPMTLEVAKLLVKNKLTHSALAFPLAEHYELIGD